MEVNFVPVMFMLQKKLNWFMTVCGFVFVLVLCFCASYLIVSQVAFDQRGFVEAESMKPGLRTRVFEDQHDLKCKPKKKKVVTRCDYA